MGLTMPKPDSAEKIVRDLSKCLVWVSTPWDNEAGFDAFWHFEGSKAEKVAERARAYLRAKKKGRK